MKSIFMALILASFTMISFAQNQSNQNPKIEQKEIIENSPYQLFPTQNHWTFLKLDTRNGKIWQVHFSVADDGTTGELNLNSIPLIDKEQEVNGRFTLYPTNNIYNFLLLDQIDGSVYQVQWSLEEEYRGVIPIF